MSSKPRNRLALRRRSVVLRYCVTNTKVDDLKSLHETVKREGILCGRRRSTMRTTRLLVLPVDWSDGTLEGPFVCTFFVFV